MPARRAPMQQGSDDSREQPIVSHTVWVAVAVGLLVGFARGGRLANVAEAGVRWPLLAIGALAVQSVAMAALDGPAAVWLVIASLAGLAAFAVRNLALPGFWLLLAGVAMNLLVIGLNGGMPVSAAALEAAGRQDVLAEARGNPNAKHHLIEPGDVLTPLSDVIPVPRPAGEVMSPGDVLVDLGIAWFLAGAMRRRREAGAGAGTDRGEARPGAG
jgi:hypothetical protein